MPDQARHDRQILSSLLNYDTLSIAGIQSFQKLLDSGFRRRDGNVIISETAYQNFSKPANPKSAL
jgi:hypothetical protein